MKPTLELIVSGTVQGVGFRWATKQVAEHLGINGSVENLPDGTVRVLAQGEHHQLDKFVDQIRKAPSSAAEVTDLSLRFVKHEAFHQFTTI
ncbi:acylphosphatase [Lactobacillus sp. Sy-1]|uniref:acylphosphatase n=1 Tax=Lactobacillus sp. Sy-1 TaxID=2109645 RepID=UPI001C570E72|nr:acylphosphatase [Lactobacillus sp. Sy-1]MBW1605681.1 acylphosphatase [Lactobacillus sp. Sy-1]